LKTRAQCTYTGKHIVKEDPASGVDGITIGAIQGDFSVTVTLMGKPPQVRAIQNVYTKKKGQGSSWMAPRGYHQYRVRLYALSDPAAKVRFTAAGKKHQLNIPGGQYREFSYTDQDQLSGLDIMMEYGKVKVVCRAEYQSATPPHILLDEPFSGNRPEKAVSAPASSGAGASASKTGSATSPGTASLTSQRVESTSRMVLVLDASGSMWGQIKNRAKIEIAKEVIGDLIDTIPATFQTGLIVYGHRRKGDCNDIEIMLPVGKHNAAAMKAKVNAISPKGKTPLSESVKRAAEALQYTEERATVILVSDGLETCDIDPCDLSAKLAMSGVDLVIHVIGFDIRKEDQYQLRCMADKTGGLFLAASDAGSLRDALFQTVEEVKAPPAPVVEDPGTAVLKGPASVPEGSAFTVKWEGPNSRGDLIAVVKKGEQDIRYIDHAYTKRGNPAELTAPGVVGDYELRYVHGHSRKVIGRADLKATPVNASITAPAAAPVAVDIEITWQGPDYTGDYIAIARPGTDGNHRIHYAYTRRGSPLNLQAPSDPGTYELRYILGKSKEILARATIQIQAATASVQAPATADVASRFEVEWKGPDNQGDYIAIAQPEKGPNHRIHYTYTKKGSPLKLLAPSDAGTYEVRYIMSQGHKLLAKTTIDIKAVGASVQAPATAAAASLIDVTWQGPNNQGDYIAVVLPGQGADRRIHYTYTKKGSPLQLRTPSDPGTYDVIYLMSQGKKVLARSAIEIQPVSAEINPPVTASVNTHIKIPWQGPGYDSDYITISRPDQAPGSRLTYRYTKRGNPAVIKTPKTPGTYEVRYILGQGKKVLAKKTITVK
jgi:Ca-activated chloride channel family protein